jgi:hypothetical protein
VILCIVTLVPHITENGIVQMTATVEFSNLAASSIYHPTWSLNDLTQSMRKMQKTCREVLRIPYFANSGGFGGSISIQWLVANRASGFA